MTSPGLRAGRLSGKRIRPACGSACHPRSESRRHRHHVCYGRAGWRSTWAGRGGAAALVLLLSGLVVAACGGQPRAHLPPEAPPASAPSPSPAPTTPSPSLSRRAAVAAYLAIWPAGDRAQRTGKAAKARAILARYAAPSYVTFMVAGMVPYWHRHEVARGHMSDHILKAKVVAGPGGHQAAIVVDCQDASHHELVHARAGRVIAGSRGPRHAKLYASMTYVGGRWLVDQITFVGSRC